MRPLHFMLLCLLILVWGLNFVVVKLGLNGFPPLFLAFARFFLTSIPVVFFVKRPEINFSKITIYGLVIFAMQFAFFFVGAHCGMPVGLASFVMQIQVFFALFLGILFFQERLKPWQIAGALISFIGIIYAGMHCTGNFSLMGFFLVILAAFCWGGGSAISKSFGKVNTLSLVVWGSTVAWPILLIFSLIFEGPTLIMQSIKHLSWIPTCSVFYLTYFSTLFGYGLWSFLVHKYPISTVAPFTLLIPVIAMITSVLVLGETLQPWKIRVSTLVLLGLCVNFLGSYIFAKKAKKIGHT